MSANPWCYLDAPDLDRLDLPPNPYWRRIGTLRNPETRPDLEPMTGIEPAYAAWEAD